MGNPRRIAVRIGRAAVRHRRALFTLRRRTLRAGEFGSFASGDRQFGRARFGGRQTSIPKCSAATHCVVRQQRCRSRLAGLAIQSHARTSPQRRTGGAGPRRRAGGCDPCQPTHRQRRNTKSSDFERELGWPIAQHRRLGNCQCRMELQQRRAVLCPRLRERAGRNITPHRTEPARRNPEVFERPRDHEAPTRREVGTLGSPRSTARRTRLLARHLAAAHRRFLATRSGHHGIHWARAQQSPPLRPLGTAARWSQTMGSRPNLHQDFCRPRLHQRLPRFCVRVDPGRRGVVR